MSTALQEHRTSADVVLQYHERTKHRLSKYAAGPETLDWDARPNPYREFAGSPRILLPLSAGTVSARLGQIYQPDGIAPAPLSIESVGSLLQLSMGLSAWKQYGPDRWALRVNPSSGNLHPTEAYVLCHDIDGIDNGLYHYLSRDHSLEQRCAAAPSDKPGARLWIALSSIHWREAWKYGERAFRYCQHDVGHAIGALRFAAGALGWTVKIVRPYPYDRLAQLLGLDREEDFQRAEKEDADVLLEVFSGEKLPAPPTSALELRQGLGQGKPTSSIRNQCTAGR
jgi:SagB-type dehydrogenase family enzyme